MSRDDLRSMHTQEAIAARILATTSHSYLGDFVLGAVDGAVTTFAIVAGAAGAGLSNGVVAVLGLANVAADGFSMAAGNYLKARADQQNLDRLSLRHRWFPYFGSVKQNRLPRPGSDSTQMRPPWRSTTFLQIARPMPVPG